MKTINKLSIVLIVCGLIMLNWHTTALSQQIGDQTISYSDSFEFGPLSDPPGRIGEGDSVTISLALSSSATMTLVKVDEPDIIASISTSFSGGILMWEFLFDDLGLPPGMYEITESFEGTLSGSLGMFGDLPPVEVSTDFDAWQANLSRGAIIIVEAVAQVDAASVGGDFVGPLGMPLPSPIPSSIKVRATRDIESGEMMSYSVAFTATLHKETSITPIIPGTINGTVADRTENPIKWALVIAINAETKEKAGTITDVDGYYEINDLEPGNYLVIGIKKGYKTGIRKAEVIAGEATTVNFTLKRKPPE